MGRVITKVDKNFVSMKREDWELFMEETDTAVGLDLHEFDAGKSKHVKYPLEVHLFLLSVIDAAIDFSGGAPAMRMNGEGCCKQDCRPFGGCDYEYGSIAVCKDGTLVVCEV